MTMFWKKMHPDCTEEMLGFIPFFLSDQDPRSAKEQFNENYAHAGGWQPFEGFKMVDDGLLYPGDPKTMLLAETKLRDETIRFYEHAWVAIVQPDGSFEICRMD